jgi:putative membrane protein
VKKLSMMSRLMFATIAAVGLCLGAVAQAAEEPAKGDASPSATESEKEMTSEKTETKGSLSTKDTKFVKKTAKGGMREVKMAEMAKQQAKSADVKKVAEKIESDHKDANKELMALAEKKDVALSKKEPKIDTMSGTDFDKEYLAMMVKDHEKDIAAFEKEAKDGEDADVKAWAEKTLPTLKEHLKMVQDAQSKMK